MTDCPDCGAVVDAGVVFCPECGRDVDHRAATPASGGEVARRTAGASVPDEADPSDTGAGGPTPDPVAGAAETPPTPARETGADAATETDSGAVTGTDAETEAETDVEGASPHAADPVSFAVGFPVRGGYRPVLVGAAFYVGVFLVPVFGWFLGLFVRGYGFQLTQAAARGQSTPPAFDGYGDLFVDGLKLLSLAVAYGVVLLFAGGFTTAVAWGVDGVLGWFLLVAWLVAGAYLYPASRAAFAATDSFAAAFSPAHAGAFVRTLTYAKAYFLWIGVLVLAVLAAAASLITVVGVLAVIPWSHYVFGSYWGYYYREAVAEGAVPAPPASAV